MERVTPGAPLALGALLASSAPAAQDVHWYAQVDNDVVAHTDRWYTSGLRLARAQRLEGGAWVELGLVQEVYTPDPKGVGPVDRPYAARLFLSGAWHVHAPGLYRTLELGAGVRGPSAYGKQTTELIHRVVPALNFDWSRQLPNRLDAQLVGTQTHEFAAGANPRWALHYGAVAGTQVSFAHVGAEVRTGGAHAIPSPALRFAATPPLAANGARGWSGFAGASARRVLRNELLAVNAHRFGPAIEREKTVHRFAAGAAWSAPWGALTFAGVHDSREFEGQVRPQPFGIVGLRLDFP